MKIKIVNFETIYPIWKDKLWKGRVTKIESSNPIDYLGKYNPKIMENKPICFACYNDNKIIGVNSLLPTSNTFCRSRGLYINTEYRLKSVGKKLIKATIKYANILGFKYIWSMPRKSALPFYLKCGFKQVSEFDEQYEFGPNCFVIKQLKGGLKGGLKWLILIIQ